MIDAKLYQDVYLIIVTILTFVVASKYGFYRFDRYDKKVVDPISLSLILCIFMAIFIGARPVSYVFMDMGGYADEWQFWNMGSYSFRWDVTNLLFDNLRMNLATTGVPVETFFMLISCIYFVSAYVACRKFFPNDTLSTYLVFLAAFSTFSYGTNGIKAGAAASLFLVALAYHDKTIVAVVFALISWGFHHSMVMVVASYLIVYFFHKPKWYFVLWGVSVMIAALHIEALQMLFASMADESGQEYLSGQEHGKGFRIDFILYSAMPVLMGYYAIYKKQIQSRAYDIILCLYLMTNSIWMLCMYAEFTNRIAYLSWLLYPVALIYPILNENWGLTRYLTLAKVMVAHLAFTLFMHVLYYYR